ncbi:peptidoglycan-binding domain-containing protein [Iningainema tapete]|uniref:Peptidoglycan-binding protein n=1 Tax=Iningainema tapete BLCC-T55 TaxID=2748662 RepID=A0A8J7C9W2_9CYAN|nr:peptidoglycan-binding protein [Iningainema tapete]MBD2776446.1 peptidoglycan-binding protein [Iningainema tapete BLCC-T55]
MNTKFIRTGVISLGFLGASLLTALGIGTAPAKAQIIIADGRLTQVEYSPATAPKLVRGTVSPAVKDVQAFLRQQGFYYGSVDGIYGPNTYSSVVTFQRSRNLPANGQIEAQTWEALIDAYNRNIPVGYTNLSRYSANTAPVLKIGSQGQAVRDVQKYLKQQGYYTGAVDGIYGRATAASVEAYQQRYTNLRNDGIVGQSTWAEILDGVS